MLLVLLCMFIAIMANGFPCGKSKARTRHFASVPELEVVTLRTTAPMGAALVKCFST